MQTVNNQGQESRGKGQKASASLDLEDACGRYTAFLLAGDKNGCQAVVQELLDAGCAVKALYQEVLQQAMYHMGELWEQNKISVAREHLATAITESMLPLIYPSVVASSETHRNGKKVIVACSANELHQLGARMVADTLEMNGWDSRFLGSNTSPETLVQTVRELKPALLCLSVSVQMNLPHLLDTLNRIRPFIPSLPIIVGGQAFHYSNPEQLERFKGVTYAASLDQLERIAAT